MEGIPKMRTKTAILSVLATSLMSFSAIAQEAAPPPAEGAPPVTEGAPAEAAAAAPAPAPEAAPAPAPAPAVAPAGYPDEYALRPLTLAAGMFQGTLPVVLNLSKSRMLKPVWIPLDLRFGVTNELEVFVSHSYPGVSPAMQLLGGGGLCLGGTSRGCEKFYNNAMLGGQYSVLKASGLELAGLLALDLRRFTGPMLMGVDVGVAVKYVAAPVSVKLVPQVSIGLNKRGEGNKEDLAVPLQIAVQAAPQIAAFLDTGIGSTVKDFSKNFMVPVGVGASYLAMHGLDVGLEFMFPTLVRGDNIKQLGGAADFRTLMLFAAWRSQ
jgi:hypothetical protein